MFGTKGNRLPPLLPTSRSGQNFNECDNPQDPYYYIKNPKKTNYYKFLSTTKTKNNKPIESVSTSSSFRNTKSQLSDSNSYENFQNSRDEEKKMIQNSFRLEQQLNLERKHQEVFECFLKFCHTSTISEAMETTMSISLKATTSTFWQDISSIHMLYSTRLQRTVPHSSGLVGYTFFSRDIVNCPKAHAHMSYLAEIDSIVAPKDTPVILFPLWDHHDDVVGVVELTRTTKEGPFNEDDIAFIKFFQAKFRINSEWMIREVFPHGLVQELMQVMEVQQFMIVFQRTVPHFFSCKKAEMWRLNTSENVLTRYTNFSHEIPLQSAGIVGDALNRGSPINTASNKMQSSYLPEVDGEEEESVLVYPVEDTKIGIKYAICLRGPNKFNVFTTEDENALRGAASYFALALENAEKFTEAELGNNRANLENTAVTRLSNIVDGILNKKDLNNILHEAADTIQELSNAERCYIFEYNKLDEKFEAIIANGTKDIELVLSKGKNIVSKTYETKEIYNIPEAYESPDFDNFIDIQSQFKTKSLLSIPVFNNQNEVLAVLQVLNKKDRKPFSTIDLKFVRMFSTIFGLILDNKKLHEFSEAAKIGLDSYAKATADLASTGSTKKILTDLLLNAKDAIGAEHCSMFIIDNVVEVLTTYITDNDKMPTTIPLSHGIAASTIKPKTGVIVNDAYHDPRFNKMIDFHSGYKTKQLCAAPIVTPDGKVLGVLEMVNKQGGFNDYNLNLLNSFSVFSMMILQMQQMKDISERGMAQLEMSKWIGEYERKSFKIPIKLQIPLRKVEEVNSLNFFAINWNGIGLFKIAFYIFDSFGLLEKFQITNEMFFTFLYKLREKYNEPPYHNWIHAIDILQYISYQVKKTHSDQMLTKFELLAVCVAALCHDAGHQGYNNAFNINAQTPLGILFKDVSVMETYHCTVAINLLSQPETNLLHSLNDQQLVIIWRWIIHLILATDMAFHQKLIKQGNEVLESGCLNLKEEKHRLMAMELIMKVSDISNVSRPFEYADKWCEVLSEEFWRQGDREIELGLPLSGPLMDRANQNKPKGQIGFYTYVCLPLYSLIARIFPELKANLDSLLNNLQKWKDLLAEQEAAAAKEKETDNKNNPKPQEDQKK